MYICINVCMYVHTDRHTHIRTHIRTLICIYTHKCVYMCIHSLQRDACMFMYARVECVHTNIHTHSCTYVNTHIYISLSYVHFHISMNSYLYLSLKMCTYMHTCTPIHTYAYIHIYICVSRQLRRSVQWCTFNPRVLPLCVCAHSVALLRVHVALPMHKPYYSEVSTLLL